MGSAVALIVFAGFARTYYLSHWVEAPARMPRMTSLLHVHAIAFTLWILLGAIQPALVARGRLALHRSLGWFGAATAAAVWLLGNLASIDAIEHGYAGLGDPYAFYAITFFSMQMFGPIVLLAILLRRDAQSHKRLMPVERGDPRGGGRAAAVRHRRGDGAGLLLPRAGPDHPCRHRLRLAQPRSGAQGVALGRRRAGREPAAARRGDA